MSPIAMSLDVLQGEEKAYVGRLLPTLAGNPIKQSKLNDCNPSATMISITACLYLIVSFKELNQGN